MPTVLTAASAYTRPLHARPRTRQRKQRIVGRRLALWQILLLLPLAGSGVFFAHALDGPVTDPVDGPHQRTRPQHQQNSLTAQQPGEVRDTSARFRSEDATSPALREFLRRFDRIQRKGYVRTRRAGSTGIGYTLEALLDIRENNSPRGDLLGMEIKAYRDDEDQFDDRHKMNLFLKEPQWHDQRTAAERIRRYGYTDTNGRPAWYQSVTAKRNSGGLSLVVDREHDQVLLQHRRRTLAHWSFRILQQRLTEKLSETVFVAAAHRGTGRDEEFHFRTVTYCRQPSVEKLLPLIEDGDVILELRMHVKASGAARNHGTAFRLKKHRLIDLFAEQRRCRPRSKTED